MVSSAKIPNPPNIERDLILPNGSNNRIESFKIGLSMLFFSVYYNTPPNSGPRD